MANVVTVTERIGFSTNKIDREKCVIHGVKLLGWESRNGATYDKAAFSKKASMYNGAKVNINHGTSTVEGRFGRVVDGSAVARDDGIYGDVRYNPHRPITESILWDVEHDPASIGMSHDADVKMQLVNGRKIYTDLVRVKSVDVVSDPATTQGVFENMNPDGTPTPDGTGGEQKPDASEQFKAQLGELMAAASQALPHDKFKEIVKHMVAAHGVLGDSEATESLRKENATLKTKLDEYQVKEKVEAGKAKARQLCKTHQLPEVAVTEHFIESIAGKGDKEMEADVLDRKKVIGVRENKPNAPTGDPNGGQLTLETFKRRVLTGK